MKQAEPGANRQAEGELTSTRRNLERIAEKGPLRTESHAGAAGTRMRRLKVKLRPGVALRVTRVSLGGERMAYVMLANRRIAYRFGQSRIVYIGTTRKGVGRIASSAASKAAQVLTMHGIREFGVRVVTCRPRRNVKTWVKLERALILTFRQVYGDVPVFNTQGKRLLETDEFRYFHRERLLAIVSTLSA